MREVLIIRSVSFQQLDHNLPVIQEHFTGARFTLLTHEHGVKLAEKYSGIDRVIPYTHREGFSYVHQAERLKGISFDDVIIPVGNESGYGFYNVMLFSLSIKARQRWICNLRSELTLISVLDILLTGLRNTLYKVLSLCATSLLFIVSILVIPLLLINIKVKEEKGS